MTMSMSDACRPDPANARLAASDARSAGRRIIRTRMSSRRRGGVSHAPWLVMEEGVGW